MELNKQNQTAPIRDEIKSYIKLASLGQYPLFPPHWEKSELLEKMNYHKAKGHVGRVFQNLRRHRTLNKKQIAILGMRPDEQKLFINSFLKLVEYDVLQNNENIH